MTLTAKRTLPDISNFNDFFVGFDRLFDHLNSASQISSSTYPPYNLRKGEKEGHVFLELALAGFKKENLSIVLEDRKLKIEGQSRHHDKESYIYQGIAGRSFTREFMLAPDVEPSDVLFEDGILTICLVQEIPEEKKPKKLEIGYSGSKKELLTEE